MTAEWACATPVPKPWGRTSLHPWSPLIAAEGPIGEIWFQRTSADATPSSLLLKLLFTSEALSIQVHPDDDHAHAIGLANGKSEAWYILEAATDASVARGLRERMDAAALRAAVDAGDLADLVAWQPVRPGEVIVVPAGTIHALGAGLVVAEIQQNSDTTYRLFDFGRERTLHIDDGLAVAEAGPAPDAVPASRIDPRRLLLVDGTRFVVEKIDLPAGSTWRLRAGQETWLLLIGGGASGAGRVAAAGDVLLVEDDVIDIEAGPAGLVGLVAYPPPVQPLLLSPATMDRTQVPPPSSSASPCACSAGRAP